MPYVPTVVGGICAICADCGGRRVLWWEASALTAAPSLHSLFKLATKESLYLVFEIKTKIKEQNKIPAHVHAVCFEVDPRHINMIPLNMFVCHG